MGAYLSEAPAMRFLRTNFSLQTIGGAALGSAVTTGGASIMLVFCTLTVFNKLGGVVLVVTAMSILMALGPLPAVLFIAGPTNPGRCLQTRPKDFVDFFFGVRDYVLQCCMGILKAPRRYSSRRRQEPEEAPPRHDDEPLSERDPRPQTAQTLAIIEETPGSPHHRPRCASSPTGQRVARTLSRPSPSMSSQMSVGTGATGSDTGLNERRRRLAEVDFDIGTESPLERIWAHEVENGGKARAVDGGGPRNMAA